MSSPPSTSGHRWCGRAELSVGGGPTATLDSTGSPSRALPRLGSSCGVRRQLRPWTGHSRPPVAVVDHGCRVDGVPTSRHGRSGNSEKIVSASITEKDHEVGPLVDAGASAVRGSGPRRRVALRSGRPRPWSFRRAIIVCMRSASPAGWRGRQGQAGPRQGDDPRSTPGPNSLDTSFHTVPTIGVADTNRAKVLTAWTQPRPAHTHHQARSHQADNAHFSRRSPVLVAPPGPGRRDDLAQRTVAAPASASFATMTPHQTRTGTPTSTYRYLNRAPHITHLSPTFIQGKPTQDRHQCR